MNNEEKILHLLEKQGEMIGQMNGRLERVEAAQIEQGQRLVEQGQRLERLEAAQIEQGQRLVEQGQRLERLEAAQIEQGQRLVEQGQRLERLEAAQIEQGQRLVEQGQRLERLEATQAEQGDLLKVLDERSLRSAVLLEADVSRDLNRLYEGHGAIMNRLDKLATRSRVEELEGDVSMLKDSVKLLRIEVNELKKAQ